jgi:RNA polymerase sigma-70 factor (ECF subfamily)
MGSNLLGYFRQYRILAGAAEDLLQDTFVRALRQPGRVRDSVSPRAYVFGIARHVCLDALRRHHPVAELPPEVAAPAAPAEDARLDGMRAAIAELPPPQREALLLKLRHELSYLEIAEVLGIPVGTVRSRLHLAVAQLKQQLNPSAKPQAS